MQEARGAGQRHIREPASRQDTAGIRLVIGLGNPGGKYVGTRHNIGFAVVDELVNKSRGEWREERKFKALVATCEMGERNVTLCKPQTYMNLSGDAVLPLVRQLKLKPSEVLVVHDELDVPFGKIKVKCGGGDAGHNGLRSITAAIGSAYCRIRVGIGRPYDGREIVDFVLQPFGFEQRIELERFVERAGNCVSTFVENGLTHTQTWLRTMEKQPTQTDQEGTSG